MHSSQRINAGDAPDRILASASDLFAQSGFNGISTREIASSASVNEVTIYRHFRTKRALSCAVLESELRKVQLRGDLLGRLAQAPDGRTALARAFELIAASLTARPGLLRLIQFGALELGETADSLLRKHLGEFVGVLAGYLEPWIASGELRTCNARSLVLSLAMIVLGYFSMGRMFPEMVGTSGELLEDLVYVLGQADALAAPACGPAPCGSAV